MTTLRIAERSIAVTSRQLSLSPNRILRSAFTPGPRLEALVLHHKAGYYLYEQRWEESLKLYQMSRPVLVGAPLTQAYSELYQVICRAGLGEGVESEVLQLQQRLEKEFPGSPQFQADLRFAVLEGLSQMRNFPEVLRRADRSIDAEPRAFHRAELLWVKAEAQRKFGFVEAARQTLELVCQTAPGSFLEARALSQLQG